MQTINKLFVFAILIALFCCSILFFACTPQQRLNRLVNRHPELLTPDTVTITDTFVIKAINADTTFRTDFDTVVFERDKVRVKIVRIHDTIRLSLMRQADTIYKTLRVPVQIAHVQAEKPKAEKPIEKWVFGLIALGLIVLLLIFKK